MTSSKCKLACVVASVAVMLALLVKSSLGLAGPSVALGSPLATVGNLSSLDLVLGEGDSAVVARCQGNNLNATDVVRVVHVETATTVASKVVVNGTQAVAQYSKVLVASDSGTYRCRAGGQESETSLQLLVTAQITLSITTPNTSVVVRNVAASGEVAVMCCAEGWPEPVVTLRPAAIFRGRAEQSMLAANGTRHRVCLMEWLHFDETTYLHGSSVTVNCSAHYTADVTCTNTTLLSNCSQFMETTNTSTARVFLYSEIPPLETHFYREGTSSSGTHPLPQCSSNQTGGFLAMVNPSTGEIFQAMPGTSTARLPASTSLAPDDTATYVCVGDGTSPSYAFRLVIIPLGLNATWMTALPNLPPAAVPYNTIVFAQQCCVEGHETMTLNWSTSAADPSYSFSTPIQEPGRQVATKCVTLTFNLSTVVQHVETVLRLSCSASFQPTACSLPASNSSNNSSSSNSSSSSSSSSDSLDAFCLSTSANYTFPGLFCPVLSGTGYALPSVVSFKRMAQVNVTCRPGFVAVGTPPNALFLCEVDERGQLHWDPTNPLTCATATHPSSMPNGFSTLLQAQTTQSSQVLPGSQPSHIPTDDTFPNGSQALPTWGPPSQGALGFEEPSDDAVIAGAVSGGAIAVIACVVLGVVVYRKYQARLRARSYQWGSTIRMLLRPSANYAVEGAGGHLTFHKPEIDDGMKSQLIDTATMDDSPQILGNRSSKGRGKLALDAVNTIFTTPALNIYEPNGDNGTEKVAKAGAEATVKDWQTYDTTGDCRNLAQLAAAGGSEIYSHTTQCSETGTLPWARAKETEVAGATPTKPRLVLPGDGSMSGMSMDDTYNNSQYSAASCRTEAEYSSLASPKLLGGGATTATHPAGNLPTDSAVEQTVVHVVYPDEQQALTPSPGTPGYLKPLDYGDEKTSRESSYDLYDANGYSQLQAPLLERQQSTSPSYLHVGSGSEEDTVTEPVKYTSLSPEREQTIRSASLQQPSAPYVRMDCPVVEAGGQQATAENLASSVAAPRGSTGAATASPAPPPVAVAALAAAAVAAADANSLRPRYSTPVPQRERSESQITTGSREIEHAEGHRQLR